MVGKPEQINKYLLLVVSSQPENTLLFHQKFWRACVKPQVAILFHRLEMGLQRNSTERRTWSHFSVVYNFAKRTLLPK